MSGPRLCHIIKWDHYDGYGFDLHAEKGKPGQYVGKVDAGSPAESAGLRHGDRILEANGVPIAEKTHKQVVEIIKAVPGEARLLVVDPDDETEIDCPENGTDTENGADTATLSASNGNDADNEPGTGANGDTAEPQREAQREEQQREGNNNAALNLNMTVAELRAKLAAKKKFDPKKESIDFKKKFDIIQKL